MLNWQISVCVLLTCLCVEVTCNKNCTSISCFVNQLQNETGDGKSGNKSWPISIEDYIREQGYPVEAHEITTEDGYMLTYHRIPHGKSSTSNGTKPVLLQHGLLCSSAVWVISATAFAYVLADAGFDVWLGNSRGNTYSRKHIKYDPDKDKDTFWDFSWHEMGYYDLPASIDYILNVTEHDQLFYIGHSMGTTMYFVLGSTRPEYMDKIQAAALMGPVMFPWHIHSTLVNYLNTFHKALEWLSNKFDIKEIFPYTHGTYWLDEHVCSHPIFQSLCTDFIFAISGHDEKEWNKTTLGTVMDYLPAGTALKTVLHFNQICSYGAPFAQFNYGYMKNKWRYGHPNPPAYDLANVKAPLYMYYALNDLLAVSEDVHYALQFLPNVKNCSAVPDPQFNHVDFMWAIDAKKLVFDSIIATLKTF